MDKEGHVLNAAFLAIGLGFVLEPTGDLGTLSTIAEVFVPLVLGALFPDVDTHFGKHRKTLHNLWVLGIVLAYPIFFNNLQWVWLGVASHYVLDVLGTTRGISLFYPLYDHEYNLPLGVPVKSDYANTMMLAVTAFELVVLAGLVYLVPTEFVRAGANAMGF
jgi:membrane-bound metal-dependent hydrolase YbcI (DUF457 family)